jgi:hypothetical protein
MSQDSGLLGVSEADKTRHRASLLEVLCESETIKHTFFVEADPSMDAVLFRSRKRDES